MQVTIDLTGYKLGDVQIGVSGPNSTESNVEFAIFTKAPAGDGNPGAFVNIKLSSEQADLLEGLFVASRRCSVPPRGPVRLRM